MAHKQREVDYVNSPTAWFCELETARQRGDQSRADRAQKELHRLGVEVSYRQAREHRAGAGRR